VPPVHEDGGGAWRRGTLAEVREGDAHGEVAEIYEDIRAVFGVSFVVLVYRTLATDPARLRAAWDAVRPNLVSAEIESLAGALAAAGDEAAARSSARVPAGSSLDPGRLADTLSAFHRVNTRNALALAALRDGLAGAPAPEAPAPAPTADVRPILPMADLDALSPRAAATLRAFSAPIAGAGRPIVIPSLLRCLAGDERLLVALWARLEPMLLDTAFADRIAATRARVDAASRRLPYAVDRCADEGSRAIVESFLRTIPAMVATAPLIADALGLRVDVVPPA
jgi:hypothetical protein